MIVLSNAQGALSFTFEMSPYYKLQIYFKMIVLNAKDANITLAYALSDNNSNSQAKLFNQSIATNYEPSYNNFTTNKIQYHSVTIAISSQSNLTFGLS